MRTIRLTLALFLGTTVFCYSQTVSPKFVYCEIVGTQKLLTTKVTVVVDFGERMRVFADNRMKDENGRAIVFNSMIDALNFMGKQGWEFAQAYTITISNQNVYHFMMKKSFEDLSEDAKQEVLKN